MIEWPDVPVPKPHVDAVLRNIKEAYRPEFLARGYDPDKPEDMKRLEADTQPLLDFYDEGGTL